MTIPEDIAFGCLPRTRTKYGDGTFPRYEDVPSMELIPRSQWQPVSMNRHVQTIYSQLDGMCTANGACGAMMVERSFRGRHHNPILSPEHLYGLVARWGEGSALDDILQALLRFGSCDRATIPPEDWHKNAWRTGWSRNAAENKMLEGIDLNADFDAVATALQRYRPCLVGVRWPGGGGHGVCATQLIRDGKGWAIRGPNSWGEEWGDKGFYMLTERQCGDFQTFGCWAVGSSA